MSVSLIGSDAVREKAVVSIQDSLAQLIALNESIFSRLTKHLELFSERLDGVGTSINRVERKLEAVRKMNTAIVVYSPAKFPAKPYERFNAVFEMAFNGDDFVDQHGGNNYLSQPVIKDAIADVKKVIDEKSKFFHVGKGKVANEKKGRVIPSTIGSVADLFLFNTSVNVFTHRGFVDPLDNTGVKVRASSRVDLNAGNEVLAAEEDSTLSVNVKEKVDPFLYEPELGTLQDFDFPDVLPDLPGIASDLTFSDNQFVPIAPSAHNEITYMAPSTSKCVQPVATVAVPAKASLEVENVGRFSATDVQMSSKDKPPATSSRISHPTTDEIGNKAPEIIIDGTTAPPLALQNVSLSSVHPSTAVPSIPPAPPPPPPPPPIPLSAPTSAAKTGNVSRSELPAGDDGRAGLMEAIRKAGGSKGANLRPVKKKVSFANEDVSALPSRNVVPSGDDLMLSLAKALELRRKGISGKNQGKEEKPIPGIRDGAMARISAMIPPPPKSEKNSKTKDFESDDDWGI